MLNKYLGAFCAIWIATVAVADEVPTLRAADGVIVKSLGTYDTFVLDPGQTSNCETGTYYSSCDLAAATVTITTPAGHQELVTFDRYFHANTQIGETSFEDWTYRGTWSNTINGIPFSEVAVLRIIERSDNPGHYTGFFKIESLGISHQLKARIEQ